MSAVFCYAWSEVWSEADGGDPILLTGPLSLCNRADGDPSRSFNGYVEQFVKSSGSGRMLCGIDSFKCFMQKVWMRLSRYGCPFAGFYPSWQSLMQPLSQRTSRWRLPTVDNPQPGCVVLVAAIMLADKLHNHPATCGLDTQMMRCSQWSAGLAVFYFLSFLSCRPCMMLLLTRGTQPWGLPPCVWILPDALPTQHPLRKISRCQASGWCSRHCMMPHPCPREHLVTANHSKQNGQNRLLCSRRQASIT